MAFADRAGNMKLLPIFVRSFFILNKTFIHELHIYNNIIHAFKPSYQSNIKRIIISQYKITCLLVYHRYCLTYHMLVGSIYGIMARNIQIYILKYNIFETKSIK